MWSVRDIVETTLAAAALVLGFCATPHALLQTWAFFPPNGETAKALRPTIIVNATVARGSSPKSTARQVNKDWMQRLIAKDLRRLGSWGRTLNAPGLEDGIFPRGRPAKSNSHLSVVPATNLQLRLESRRESHTNGCCAAASVCNYALERFWSSGKMGWEDWFDKPYGFLTILTADKSKP
ncbi:hypothetical protein VE04_09819, partial [Pseudogymnoascus sp. 24MN13]